ncbi:class A beta-lactamase, subclass A2 [Chryseolinea lacunae]|uniref:Beta-lactamase n=1 Tax=Chryseolinea lacunae TaxID=2801331 RepID=A0ABS1KP45_9BACT|nr:class A beta-lactamase, subclass A2 [Chryseolinea lacunae]MBL0740031.1 class A beta-lactamase, subclass A2 [Chryseolinea lacunae]
MIKEDMNALRHKLKTIVAMAVVSMVCLQPAVAQNNAMLRTSLAEIAATLKADVGVAILDLERGDTVMLNGHQHFPMQSVYKFPLALMVLRQVDQGKLSLDKKIKLRKEDLLPNTWSPLAKKYPEGNVEVTLREILSYTVSQSDNNGCDVLFRLMGGTANVHDYVHSLGVTEIAIAATEEEMHRSWPVQFTNWCEPVAMAQLLKQFDRGNILSMASRDFLWKIMVETTTGPKKLKGLLPAGTVVAHKTGMGDYSDDGVLGAQNDAGIIVLPNGKRIAIAVFISNTRETDNEKIELVIARLSKATYDHFNTKR